MVRYIIAAAIIVADQLTKFLIHAFQPNITLGFLNISYITNTGAAFGILQNQTFILGIISAIAAFLIIYYDQKIPQKQQILFAILLGGIIGNLIDRVLRNFVIDFINFSFWPAFNVADAAITLAAVGLIVQEIFQNKDK